MGLISLGPGRQVSSTSCAGVLQEFLTNPHRSTLTMIKEVEEMGGSAEYVRSLTDTNVPGILEYSKWPSTPCSVTTAQIGLFHNYEIAATALHVGTQVKTWFSVVPTTLNAMLRVHPGMKLDGQKCGWFVAPDLKEENFILCFYVGNMGNTIAIVEGPGQNVELRSGGANEVVWV